MKRILIAIALVASLCSTTLAEDSPFLPDRAKTPGEAAPNVSLSDICTPGYSKRARGAIPAAGWKTLRQKVFARYGHDFDRESKLYETDHLLPIELGGANAITNLWTEPWDGEWNARVKDRLENRLHKMVCPGRDGSPPRLALAQAQQEIETDWIAAYKKYVGPTPAATRPRRRSGGHRRDTQGYQSGIR